MPAKNPKANGMSSAARKATKLILDRSLKRRSRPVADLELTRDAWVVAPHPDDETLGCGGTVLEKCGRGARVHVAFVSDGSGSHARWMDRGELARRRKSEGARACELLGVRPGDVHFLDLPDGEISRHIELGAVALSRLFVQHPTQQFFLPHRREPPADHAAAYTIAIRALRDARITGTIFEYPVWMWARWPWVRPTGRPPRGRWGLLSAARSASDIAELLRELECRVDVRHQLAAKHQALSCHETQTRRLMSAEDWPILADVSEGELVERFFCGWEYFHRSRA